MKWIASARAHANIAIIKYWGKRDRLLVLPNTDSLSITLDKLYTNTTVEFGRDGRDDRIILNNQVLEKGSHVYKRFTAHLERIRALAGTPLKAVVHSTNAFPTGSGLASSASGFMALTLAAVRALDLPMGQDPIDWPALSRLARQGSGSACRSAYGGFVIWHRGGREDGEDSFAEQILTENEWPNLRILVTLVSRKEKPVSSRAGMERTVSTSPFYQAWPGLVKDHLRIAMDGIRTRNISTMGEVAEMQALALHALAMTASPPILYWRPETISLMKRIQDMRSEGIPCYYTMDAGPHVFVLCMEKDVDRLSTEMKAVSGAIEVFPSRPGPGPSIEPERPIAEGAQAIYET